MQRIITLILRYETKRDEIARVAKNRARIATAIRTHITAAMLCMAAVIAPMGALAAESEIKKILTNTQDVLKIVLAIVMTLAFVVFIWGIVKLIAAAGSPQKMMQAKGIILYGIIGIAIMATITGIIAFLQAYFGVTGGVPIKVPQFPM